MLRSFERSNEQRQATERVRWCAFLSDALTSKVKGGWLSKPSPLSKPSKETIYSLLLSLKRTTASVKPCRADPGYVKLVSNRHLLMMSVSLDSRGRCYIKRQPPWMAENGTVLYSYSIHTITQDTVFRLVEAPSTQICFSFLACIHEETNLWYYLAHVLYEQNIWYDSNILRILFYRILSHGWRRPLSRL